MKIGYFGTFDTGPGYPRNDGLIAAFRRAGHEVSLCRASLWRGNADKLSAMGGAVGRIRSAGRLAQATIALRREFKRMGEVDCWVVGALGVPDILLLKKMVGDRTPIVLDAFFSVFEAIVEDRRLWAADSLKARGLAALERRCLEAADGIFTDTHAHAEFLSERFGVEIDRFSPIPVGSRLAGHRATPVATRQQGDRPLELLFVGTYIPLHGIQTILEAEAILMKHGFPHRLTMLGAGQLLEPMQRTAQRLGLDRIRWIDRLVEEEELIENYRAADLVLGVFGDGPKTQRVIPCKIYDALACGRPILTADHAVLGEFFDGESIARCAPRPEALASAVMALGGEGDRLAKMGAECRTAYDRVASADALGSRVNEALARWAIDNPPTAD